MNKLKVGIIGSGNIGTDLMMKLQNNPFLELTTMVGIDPESDGLNRAKELGIEVIDNGIQGFIERKELADLLFDATSAKAHFHHAKVLGELKKRVIDLTPAAIGPFVVPPVNLGSHIIESNVNLITCGGQATIPIVHAVGQIAEVEYAEIVATISSKSAGPGTRANIDEFTVTTARGLEEIGGAKKGKAIIILNPAEPPIMMRDTVYCKVTNEDFNHQSMIHSVKQMVKKVQAYVPGYRLRMDPIIDGSTITVYLEVQGSGDYLPSYAGNLDIMTASAVKVAEEIAQYEVVKTV
ncbi:acetaldehyde dehydrogenase (acetylating) [Bacillus sp. AFS088145]|uniref:acetaldehyde dehydrogenase (acetylating) n=1 Tax=Bacillus sp. AFS088145 TaxID=2033514 RepID=UPI000BF8147B|nr:acetaldehyde dehydrogenase (acetylating) [Bacillus sp. AFS088145]PFH82916.1 acetaldehyde dehydrogenase (acetylating) [Bacillus sp. AFS088145]